MLKQMKLQFGMVCQSYKNAPDLSVMILGCPQSFLNFMKKMWMTKITFWYELYKNVFIVLHMIYIVLRMQFRFMWIQPDKSKVHVDTAWQVEGSCGYSLKSRRFMWIQPDKSKLCYEVRLVYIMLYSLVKRTAYHLTVE